jgi:hypothetical protein
MDTTHVPVLLLLVRVDRNTLRTSIFLSNVAKIERHNNKSLSCQWKLAANSFADMSTQEFTNAYLSGYRPRTASRPNLRVAVPAPSNDNFAGNGYDARNRYKQLE